MSKIPSHNILMAGMIQAAIENDSLLLYTQKISLINQPDKPTTHFELLIRMKGRKNNVIKASSFIVIAERFNLITNIDRWILTQILTHYDK